MTILHQYMIKQILRNLVMMLFVIITLFVAVDYISNIDEFVSAGFSFGRSLYVVLLKMPMVFSKLLPICGMLATVIALGVMNRNNELLAMKGGGIGIGFTLTPVLIVGAGMALGSLVLTEWISPVTSKAFYRIRTTEIRKTGLITTERHNLWVKKDRRIMHIKHINLQARRAFGITSYTFNPEFKLLKRIDAREAVITENGEWELHGATVQVFEPISGTPDISHPATYPFDSGIAVADLKDLGEETDALSITELASQIKKLESEGYDATNFRVDLSGKLAFPFTHLIFGVIAAGIATRRRFREKLPASVGLSVATAFFFWSLYSFSLSLGHGDMLPPMVSAWGPLVIFSFIAAYLMITVDG